LAELDGKPRPIVGALVAFLSLACPDWTVELGAVAGQMISRIKAARPGLSDIYLRPDLTGTELCITIPGVPDGDRGAAIWAAATVVAQLWPGWLADAHVGLVIYVPGASARADAELMCDLAQNSIGRGQWLSRAIVEIQRAT